MTSANFGDRLIALFLLGVLLISPPLLAVVRADVLVAGIPLLFLYLFVAWALLVGLLALAIETGRGREAAADSVEPKRQS
ncbi:MAG: hypothetical protein HYR63_13265 [Proteobacteria bacterium]|nr:hypothetical protein [Pseudomonadota bacterium]MBI3496934.1 hypothetical protein [Pseudomonadota bacterium]